MDKGPDKLVVLEDLLNDDDSILLGWAIPADRLDFFVAEMDRAAQRAGGVSFSELDFDNYDRITQSAINRTVIDRRDSIIDAAAEIIECHDANTKTG